MLGHPLLMSSRDGLQCCDVQGEIRVVLKGQRAEQERSSQGGCLHVLVCVHVCMCLHVIACFCVYMWILCMNGRVCVCVYSKFRLHFGSGCLQQDKAEEAGWVEIKPSQRGHPWKSRSQSGVGLGKAHHPSILILQRTQTEPCLCCWLSWTAPLAL